MRFVLFSRMPLEIHAIPLAAAAAVQKPQALRWKSIPLDTINLLLFREFKEGHKSS